MNESSHTGRFSFGIDLAGLAGAAASIHGCRPGIEDFRLANRNRIFVVASGSLVNLAAGDGNPIEIMDLGLALQSLSLEQMALHGRDVDAGVHPVAIEIEQAVAALAVEAWV